MIPLTISLKVLLPILVLCMFKYLLGAPAMSVYIDDFGIIGTILLTTLSGTLGATITVFFGAAITLAYRKAFPKVEKKFTKWNRKLAWLRNRTGLIGIAFITPIFLSIPVGSLIALSLAKDKSKVILYVGVSCLFWAIVILSPIYFLGFNWVNYLKQLF